MGARIVKTGQLLDGRFRLVEEIGQGGMSTIFKAEVISQVLLFFAIWHHLASKR